MALLAIGRSGDQATDVVAEARRRAAGVWPGFDPTIVPVMLFDGRQTMLSGHPNPPAGFPWQGRHPEVTANSSVELAGVRTATVMPFRSGTSMAQRAGLVAHEMFHVFTLGRHPGWTANEVEAFSYPADRAEVLASRRAEYRMLRRALAASNRFQRVCWAKAALAARRQRYALMSAGSIGYERAGELAEGLADYVEKRAAAGGDADVMPNQVLQPEDIRNAVYATGNALARLLDLEARGWRDTLEQRDSLRLDVMLAATLDTLPGQACALGSVEAQRLIEDAGRDVAALRQRRAADLAAHEGREGWKITIVAGAEPLWPQRFDPLNVRLLDSATVLHRRMIRLGNGAGSVEVLGHEAVTRAAGAHALFNGLRALTITGLANAPSFSDSAGTIILDMPTVKARLRGSLDRRTSEVVIRLP